MPGLREAVEAMAAKVRAAREQTDIAVRAPALLALRPDQDKLQAEFPEFDTWVMVSQLDTKGVYRVIRYPGGAK